MEELQASGLTRVGFCRQRGIAVTTLDYWRQRILCNPRLVKMKIAGADTSPRSFTLRLTNGRSIDSSWRFDEKELARLIHIAERA